MKSKPNLVISEIFGPTIQGEGPSIGTPAVFVRLGGCNLRCVWCDTAYTWDWTRFNPKEELHSMTMQEVGDDVCHRLREIQGVGNQTAGLLVITGGEPLLQRDKLALLLPTIREQFPKIRFEVETAGTLEPDILINYVNGWNVSPKLAHSGNSYEKRIVPEVLRKFAVLSRSGQACFKFVVQAVSDLAEVDKLVTEFEMEQIIIMPEGITTQRLHEIKQHILGECISRGYRITPRLHVDLFGNRRGV